MRDGRSALVHVRAFVRRNPDRADALAEVTPGPVPVAAAMAVRAFESLSASRGSGINGAHPIGLVGIDAYTRLLAPLTSRDVGLILAMDSAAREASSHG